MPKGICKGFTLVELIAVLVLVAVISTVAITGLTPSTTLQLQSSRDTIVAAFFSAQQRAMAQTAPVQLIAASNSVDIRIDANGDKLFSNSESISVGGIQYPISLIQNQTLTSAIFSFDRLGRTSATDLILSQPDGSVNISISANGAVN